MNSSPGISPGTSILLTGGAGFIDSHLAVRTGVRYSPAQPLLYERVNLQGRLGLLDLARRGMCRKLVFGSSRSVYGSTSRMPFSEDTRRTG